MHPAASAIATPTIAAARADFRLPVTRLRPHKAMTVLVGTRVRSWFRAADY
jgi:hypothetical protein